jgi:predicted GTPase
MEEILINFETAKLAKEKGFNEKVYREYDKFGYLRCTSKSANVVLGPYEELLKSTEYSASTQSLLQKWLREVHKIHIDIRTNGASGGCYFFYLFQTKVPFYTLFISEKNSDTYEEALEYALKESLKLIK